MSDPQQPPLCTNPSKTSFLDLAERKRELAVQAATLQSQLRAIDGALDALEQNALDETIHIELTKNDAVMLMAACWQFTAHVPKLDEQLRAQIDGYGKLIFDAIFTQNSDFAQRVMRSSGQNDTPTGENHSGGQGESGTLLKRKLPKKGCPYLRYTEEQMESARAKSSIGVSYDYATADHVRLHLSRAALLEMYRRPRHTKIVYARIMMAIDNCRSDSAASLFGARECLPSPDRDSSRAKPYDKYTESEMREGLRRIGLSPGQVKFSYGYLTISLNRTALLRLYRGRSSEPGIAYLLMVCDDRDAVPHRHAPIGHTLISVLVAEG
jgi:hypothetical protein